jgi:phosphatidylinositol glycan class V
MFTRYQIDLRAILSAIILALVSVSPSIAYQYVAYRVFCREVISTRPAWCNNNLPSIYNHVQLKYWDVGFLRYWTPAQIPNFVLAAPVLTLLFVFCIHHLTTVMPALFDDASMISLGLQSERRPHMLRHPGKPFLRRSITPHAAHAVILSVILLFSAHVQIVLRFAAALPVVYWAGAWLVLDHPTWGHAWVTYSIVWGTVSVVLWAAFLPPA